jgi:hypothetical protein
MSTTLRQVLEQFEQSEGTVSLPQMARALGIERGTLQNMIDYWVRKGKLREVGAPACTTCGSAAACPFVVALPRCYELATAEPAVTPATVSCGCGCDTGRASCH